MAIQEKLNRQGQQHIINLAHTIRQLWRKMMQDLCLPKDSKFADADLLKTSKYHQFYDKALSQYWQAKDDYANGGYVGLTIKHSVSPQQG